MIAEVWSKRAFVAVGFVLAGILLIGLAELVDSAILTTVGILVINLSWVVLIAWRIIGGPGQRHDHDEWV
jgi:hypothetical protein